MNFPQPSFQQNKQKKGNKEVEQLNRRQQQVSIDEIISKNQKYGSLYLGNLEAALNIEMLKQKQINFVLTLGSNIKIDYKKRIKDYESKLKEEQQLLDCSSSCSEDNSNLLHQQSSCSSLSSENEQENKEGLKIISLNIDIEDIQYSDMSRHFNRTYEFIESSRLKGNVLVHCMMGISRSATIVIAYLMQHQKLSHHKAFQIVKMKRSCIQPNKGFIRQLNELERHFNLNQTLLSSTNKKKDEDQ